MRGRPVTKTIANIIIISVHAIQLIPLAIVT